MNFITFILLFVTFPFWLPVVGGFFIGIGMLWMICYPIACTTHLFYVRMFHGYWPSWQLLYPGL